MVEQGFVFVVLWQSDGYGHRPDMHHAAVYAHDEAEAVLEAYTRNFLLEGVLGERDGDVHERLCVGSAGEQTHGDRPLAVGVIGELRPLSVHAAEYAHERRHR